MPEVDRVVYIYIATCMHKMYLHYISLPQGFGEKEPFRYFDSNRLVGGGTHVCF